MSKHYIVQNWMLHPYNGLPTRQVKLILRSHKVQLIVKHVSPLKPCLKEKPNVTVSYKILKLSKQKVHHTTQDGTHPHTVEQFTVQVKKQTIKMLKFVDITYDVAKKMIVNDIKPAD